MAAFNIGVLEAHILSACNCFNFLYEMWQKEGKFIDWPRRVHSVRTMRSPKGCLRQVIKVSLFNYCMCSQFIKVESSQNLSQKRYFIFIILLQKNVALFYLCQLFLIILCDYRIDTIKIKLSHILWFHSYPVPMNIQNDIINLDH